ncbi:MAG TPA: CHASE2 domain-containing protein [Usitatibacter sp.]|nr:CHASE2 domain-containing protein [Usitatibacter sp.]
MKTAGEVNAASRAFAMVAVAIAGLAFWLTPLADRLEGALLDLQWTCLRGLAPRPAPDDIVIVGVDEATIARIREPMGLWHETLGKALVRIASAKPRAIALDLALPERSQDAVRAGLDRALLVGLAAARDNGPLVAALSIDARTRGARPIYPPFLAVLGADGLGLGLLARDADGISRRFSVLVPTEDGGFPTLAGRLCRALMRECVDGYIHYAAGAPFEMVPLHRILESTDVAWLRKTLGGRVVMIGDTLALSGRVDVPVNYAGWERARGDSPAIVVHAQALRTALLGIAPQETSRAMMLLLVSLAALVFLVRDWRWCLVAAGLGAAILFAGALLALRAGWVLPMAAPLATAVLACTARALMALTRNFAIRRR